MGIPVYASATLRTFTDKSARVEVEDATVREVLERLQEEYPDSKKALFNETGALRPLSVST